MEVAEDSMYVIKYDKIITMTEVKQGQMIDFLTNRMKKILIGMMEEPRSQIKWDIFLQ